MKAKTDAIPPALGLTESAGLPSVKICGFPLQPDPYLNYRRSVLIAPRHVTKLLAVITCIWTDTGEKCSIVDVQRQTTSRQRLYLPAYFWFVLISR